MKPHNFGVADSGRLTKQANRRTAARAKPRRRDVRVERQVGAQHDYVGHSAFDSENVCLDLAVDWAGSEPLRDCCRRKVGCFAEP